MNSRPCPVCQGEKYDLYLEDAYALAGKALDLIRCRGCGLVRVEPMLDIDQVRGLYNADYFDQDFSCGVRKGTYLESEAMRVGEYREILTEIRRYRPSGRLLEIGCAAGSFLKYAERSGYQAEGVDISEWAAATAMEQFGIKVHNGRLGEIEFPDESFDVIYCGDLLEHEPDPEMLIKETRRIMKTGGLLAIKVPTYVNSFYFRLARRTPFRLALRLLDARLLQAMKLMYQDPPAPPYHLYEYSLDTVARLLENSRISVVGHKTSLLTPEFLDRYNAGPIDRATLLGFKILREAVVRLNLPAGHVLVFGLKG